MSELVPEATSGQSTSEKKRRLHSFEAETYPSKVVFRPACRDKENESSVVTKAVMRDKLALAD